MSVEEEFKNFVNGDTEEQTNNEETGANGASQKSANINEGAEVKTEQNGNGSQASGGMTKEEINKLANEGKKLLPFEKYGEQILFGKSLEMEQADKEWAWKQYVAYNIEANNEGRKSPEYSENSVQKAQKMGERTEAAWQKLLPLKVESLEAITDWIKEGLWVQRSRTKEAFTAWKNGAVKLLIHNIDSTYSIDKLRGGHNSPEALLAEICDEATGLGKDGPIIVEAEVPDKRLVVVEEELTRLFAVNGRNGSGMSEMLRLFYDAPRMGAAPSRRSKLKSTCPHVSVLGHLTPDGLKHSMPTVEVLNGLANRFMHIASQRTASIPEPADVDWTREDLNLKVQYLQKVVREFH